MNYKEYMEGRKLFLDCVGIKHPSTAFPFYLRAGLLVLIQFELHSRRPF